jgi:predicted AAA+ superfamily ATPase
MPFPRDILLELEKWKSSPNRKPLILRGARQVGKTVAVKMFGERYDKFIYLNLDLPHERIIFEKKLPVQDTFQAILLKHKKNMVDGRLLLFLDEIQECSEAVESLRYFHEDLPNIDVVAAGSLLEIALHQKQISFPVGRVDHLYMHPLSFQEYLKALGNGEIISALETLPFPAYAHRTLLENFHRYALIGGMPEIIARYRETEEITSLNSVYNSLLTSYIDDIGKYARNESIGTILRHCIETAPFAAGQRISFAGFGASNYRSREVGESLHTLQRAMLLYLTYPSTAVEIPIRPDLRKKPRLQFIDTGLINYFAGLQEQHFLYDDLHAFYKGLLAEHIVGQELIASEVNTIKKICFWVREKPQSQAEVDFIIQHGEYVVPVEVKAGPTGKLRSLHQFMDRCPHTLAVRLYSGNLDIQETRTPAGKRYHLLNLPYFLASRIRTYLDWMREEISIP